MATKRKKTKATKKKTSATKTASKKKAKKTKATKAKTKKTVTSKAKVTAKKVKNAVSSPTAITGIQPAPTLGSFENTAPRVEVGDTAPDFTLLDQTGNHITLSDFRGKNLVLYFYPKDDTPGCTKEACSFRDNIARFNDINAVVLGVSFDDQPTHQKFIEKYGLNFSLLSDLNKDVAKKYGVYVQKNMYGNISWGIERSTFVIDAEGKIAAAIRKVSVDGHTDQVLEVLNQLTRKTA